MIELGVITLFAVVIFLVFTRSVYTFRKNIKEGEFCHYYQFRKLTIGIILIIDGNIIIVENIATKEKQVVKKTDLYPPLW